MTAPVQPPAEQRRQVGRRRAVFGDHVAEEVDRLQAGYLATPARPTAVATLARLRAAIESTVNSSYAILPVTEVPEEFLRQDTAIAGRPQLPVAADEPLPSERAKHAALTLYAVHQQSLRDRRMHRDGVGLGTAVALLVSASPNPEAVRRRFAALGTATTPVETVRHLRGLVRLLRDARIALDYGLLADDLRMLHRPDGPDRVRAWWGREHYRALNAARAKNKNTEEETA